MKKNIEKKTITLGNGEMCVIGDRPRKYNNLDPHNHVTSSGPITSRYLSKISNITRYDILHHI